MKKSILLHVGVEKSGTTALQENVFSKLRHIDCLGRPNHLISSYQRFSEGIQTAENQELHEEARDFLQLVKESKNNRIVISDETLLGRFLPLSIVSDRLCQVFPDAHVLITIRNQSTAIKSFYVDSGRFLKGTPISHRGGIQVSFKEYFDFNIDRRDGFFRILDYYELVNCFINSFGKKNVSVMLFEHMVNSPDYFFEKVGRILATPESELLKLWKGDQVRNKRESARLIKYQNWRSKLPFASTPVHQIVPVPKFVSSSWQKFLRKGAPCEPEFSCDDQERIRRRYGLNNRLLSNEHNLPLGEWGYPGF